MATGRRKRPPAENGVKESSGRSRPDFRGPSACGSERGKGFLPQTVFDWQIGLGLA